MMTKRRSAEEDGLEPFFMVRVVFRGGAIVHLASWTEPNVRFDQFFDVKRVSEVEANWIGADDEEDVKRAYGDVIGYIDWSEVVGVTWRWCA